MSVFFFFFFFFVHVNKGQELELQKTGGVLKRKIGTAAVNSHNSAVKTQHLTHPSSNY